MVNVFSYLLYQTFYSKKLKIIFYYISLVNSLL